MADVGDQADGDTVMGRVVKIADGDTITVRLDGGQRRKVRLLAIDTPESYATRYGYAECGGERAKEALQALVARSPRATLTADPSQDEQDRYGRWLAYVAPAGGGETFQAALARAGWAEVYRFDEEAPPAARRRARPARRGRAQRRRRRLGLVRWFPQEEHPMSVSEGATELELKVEAEAAARTLGDIVDEITAALTGPQVAWCVEQARNCDVDPFDELSDRAVLVTYVRRYGAAELRCAADSARMDHPPI